MNNRNKTMDTPPRSVESLYEAGRALIVKRTRTKNKIVPTRTAQVSCDPARLLEIAGERLKDGSDRAALHFARLACGVLDRQIARQKQTEVPVEDLISHA